jgi:hypothetical protein
MSRVPASSFLREQVEGHGIWNQGRLVIHGHTGLGEVTTSTRPRALRGWSSQRLERALLFSPDLELICAALRPSGRPDGGIGLVAAGACLSSRRTWATFRSLYKCRQALRIGRPPVDLACVTFALFLKYPNASDSLL